jgi:Domain of unknown function (DUF5710)
MTSPTRIDLTVPFTGKEQAKALGARRDAEQRTWYAPPGTDLRHFDRRWLPKGCEFDAEAGSSAIVGTDAVPEEGISLTDLLKASTLHEPWSMSPSSGSNPRIICFARNGKSHA